MASKGEPVKWVTVRGRRIPIYEDGSMGGFMEGKKTTDVDTKPAKKDKYEDDEHHPTALGDVKKGDFFKLSNSPNGKVYVRDDYDKSEKAYWCYEFYDVNSGRYMKKNKTVYTGFTF